MLLVRSTVLLRETCSVFPQPKMFESCRLKLVALVPPARPNEMPGLKVHTSLVMTLISTLPSAKRTGTMCASYTYMSARRLRSVSASLRALNLSPILNRSCAWIAARLVLMWSLFASLYKPLFSRGSSLSKILRISMSIAPMTAPEASKAASLGIPAGRGSSIRVCSLSVSFAANPGAMSVTARIVSASHGPLPEGFMGRHYGIWRPDDMTRVSPPVRRPARGRAAYRSATARRYRSRPYVYAVPAGYR